MGNTVNERELVMEVLLAVTRDGQYSHLALGSMLEKYQYLSKNERAFITRVSEGTLEHMIEIDYIINQFSKVKVNKMKPVIRAIVRSAVYQLKYMDSVPDSAVCNEAVKLAGKRGFSGLRGFVNGLLRNISRNMDEVKYPDPSDKIRWLSVTYSMPEWIVKQLLSDYPEETVAAILEDFQKEKPTSVRCNLSKISREDLKKALEEESVTVKLHPTLDCAMYLSDYDYLGALECFEKGYFQVQDVSSMEVAVWAAPNEGDYIIDVCAAPGGKSLHLADMLRGTGHVEARDLTEYKVNLILDNIERSGLNNIDAVCMDATVPDETSIDKADIVIADIPCSGLGVLGKKTDLKYKMTEQMQQDLVKLQREILSVVHRYVKPGGKLLYSTCTIHRAENEENAKWFEAQYPEFEKVRERQFIPGVDESDGFYIAEFRRNV
ncbi:MAG: 16S rRNA (cytosine(967)-C(5))-methyltransferase RsmB [Eubacteriales bacterium]|nr:16S rRNA (cytosine(967)-C(5))-methyltransferase RsmB [Eubacteriales bacterium]